MAKLEHYPDEDVLYVHMAPGAEVASRELHPNITAEFGTGGVLLGIEILRATETLLTLVQPLLDVLDPEIADLTSFQQARKDAKQP